jgi:hypothetical protein
MLRSDTRRAAGIPRSRGVYLASARDVPARIPTRSVDRRVRDEERGRSWSGHRGGVSRASGDGTGRDVLCPFARREHIVPDRRRGRVCGWARGLHAAPRSAPARYGHGVRAHPALGRDAREPTRRRARLGDEHARGTGEARRAHRAEPCVRDPGELGHRAFAGHHRAPQAEARARQGPPTGRLLLSVARRRTRQPRDRRGALRHGIRRHRGPPGDQGLGRDHARAGPGVREVRRHAAERDRCGRGRLQSRDTRARR